MPRRIVLVCAVLLIALSAASPRAASYQASPTAGTPCPTTTEEENEALVRRFHEEAWERGNVDVVDEMWAPTTVYERALGEGTRDPASRQARIREFRTGFPDLQEELAFVVTEGDLVVLNWTRSGTHLGVWDGADPTGRVVTWTGVTWYRIECGLIVAGGTEADTIGLRLQVGILTDEELASVDTPPVATPVP